MIHGHMSLLVGQIDLPSSAQSTEETQMLVLPPGTNEAFPTSFAAHTEPRTNDPHQFLRCWPWALVISHLVQGRTLLASTRRWWELRAVPSVPCSRAKLNMAPVIPYATYLTQFMISKALRRKSIHSRHSIHSEALSNDAWV